MESCIKEQERLATGENCIPCRNGTKWAHMEHWTYEYRMRKRKVAELGTDAQMWFGSIIGTSKFDVYDFELVRSTGEGMAIFVITSALT